MSDFHIRHNPYDRSYEVTYESRTPFGWLPLLDGETGEPVRDVFSGQHAESEAHAHGLYTAQLLQVMDSHYG